MLVNDLPICYFCLNKMSRWLPPELHCVIYSYITDADFINYLLNNLNPKEKVQLQTCIIALLRSKWDINPAYLNLFPNLLTVAVPVEIDDISGSHFTHFPYITLKYLDQDYLNGALIAKFLSEYAPSKDLSNKIVKFRTGNDRRSQLIIKDKKVKINTMVDDLGSLYPLLYDYNSLRSLTVYLYTLYYFYIDLLLSLPQLTQVKFRAISLMANSTRLAIMFSKMLLSPYLTNITVKRLVPVLRRNSDELLLAFTNKLNLDQINYILTKFHVPLSLAKAKQMIPMLPKVQKFYLIWPFPKDDLNDHEYIQAELTNLNIPNVTYQQVFIDDRYRTSWLTYIHMKSTPSKLERRINVASNLEQTKP